MNISERAQKYLQTLKRDSNFVSDEKETKEYLFSQNIETTDEFLKFQVQYSGYELTIDNDCGNSFSASLFSKTQIKKNLKLEIEKAGDRYIEVCGDHKTAQFTFFLTHKGEFCTLDDDDLPNILHSSFDKLVEEYALRNEISDWDSNPYYHEIKDINRLERLMNDNFDVIEECSDEYSTWWRKDSLIAVKGVWLDRPEFYFRIYGKNEDECYDFIEELSDKNIIK
ncbi:hypothetical protein ACE939_04110 [Aquimarina sp. W85]|uniref:hypothetical protein n=1 Tax=Aquimarina rhodophyticola TaxID=3342246 RepID=UPI00366BF300